MLEERLDEILALFPAQLQDRLRGIELKVIMDDSVDFGHGGLAMADYDYVEEQGRIYLNMPEIVQQDCLAGDLVWHEIIHIEQYKTGRLTYCCDVKTKALCSVWENELYEEPKDLMGYLNLPWEVEAYYAQAGFISAHVDSTRSVRWHYLNLMREIKHSDEVIAIR